MVPRLDLCSPRISGTVYPRPTSLLGYNYRSGCNSEQAGGSTPTTSLLTRALGRPLRNGAVSHSPVHTTGRPVEERKRGAPTLFVLATLLLEIIGTPAYPRSWTGHGTGGARVNGQHHWRCWTVNPTADVSHRISPSAISLHRPKAQLVEKHQDCAEKSFIGGIVFVGEFLLLVRRVLGVAIRESPLPLLVSLPHRGQ